MSSLRSQGSLALARLCHTPAVVGNAAGVSAKQAAQWMSGEACPGDASRHKLLRAYKIPANAWDRPCGSSEPAPASTPGPEPTAPGPPPTAPASASTPAVAPAPASTHVGNEPATTAELAIRLRRQVESLLSQLEDSTPAQQAAVSHKAAQTLHMLGKWEGSNLELTEQQILATPQWRRLASRMLEALNPYTDAMVAVRDAIDPEVTRGQS